MIKMNWHEYFLNICDQVALKSKDRHTNFGAVIVGPGKEIKSTGYNGFCRGINDKLEERYERPEKYFWFEHAERNAIFNAARCGISTLDCDIYIQSMPCIDCARAIVQSGIKNVFLSHDKLVKRINLLKQENKQPEIEVYKRTMQLFLEANVYVYTYKNTLERLTVDDFKKLCD